MSQSEKFCFFGVILIESDQFPLNLVVRNSITTRFILSLHRVSAEIFLQNMLIKFHHHPWMWCCLGVEWYFCQPCICWWILLCSDNHRFSQRSINLPVLWIIPYTYKQKRYIIFGWTSIFYLGTLYRNCRFNNFC